jgi:hypothetical protein
MKIKRDWIKLPIVAIVRAVDNLTPMSEKTKRIALSPRNRIAAIKISLKGNVVLKSEYSYCAKSWFTQI